VLEFTGLEQKKRYKESDLEKGVKPKTRCMDFEKSVKFVA